METPTLTSDKMTATAFLGALKVARRGLNKLDDRVTCQRGSVADLEDVKKEVELEYAQMLMLSIEMLNGMGTICDETVRTLKAELAPVGRIRSAA